MPGVTRAASLLVVLLLAVALGACGEKEGDTKADKKAYVTKVNEVQVRFASEVTTVTTQYTSKSSPDQDRKTLNGFENAVSDLVDELRAIKVPTSLKAEHAQLIAALSGYAKDIDQANGALDNPTTRSFDQASVRIKAATRIVLARLSAAIQAINGRLKAAQ